MRQTPNAKPRPVWSNFPASGVSPMRANQEHPVTQLWYAKQGIITPEMEFIAIPRKPGPRGIAY